MSAAEFPGNKIDFSFPILPDIYNISSPKQFQVYEIFNNVCDLDLPVMNGCITKSHVSRIILVLRLQIFLPLNVITVNPIKEKIIANVAQLSADRFIIHRFKSIAFQCICNFVCGDIRADRRAKEFY